MEIAYWFCPRDFWDPPPLCCWDFRNSLLSVGGIFEKSDLTFPENGWANAANPSILTATGKSGSGILSRGKSSSPSRAFGGGDRGQRRRGQSSPPTHSGKPWLGTDRLGTWGHANPSDTDHRPRRLTDTHSSYPICKRTIHLNRFIIWISPFDNPDFSLQPKEHRSTLTLPLNL